MRFTCSFTGTTPRKIGIGSQPVPGATEVSIPGETNIFTTPELSPLGLGYKIRWYAQQESHPNYCGPQYLTPASIIQTVQPGCYIDMTTQNNNVKAEFHLIFHKIGPITHTGGTTIPTSVITNLVNVYAAGPDAPLNVTGVNQFYWSTNTLTTAVRACTPLVDQTVNFNTIHAPQSTTPGQVLASRTFTLNFTCPHIAFHQIGYVFQPVYGTHSATVMKLDNAPGSAQGVGISIRPSDSNTYVEFNRPEAYYISTFNAPALWDHPNFTRNNALTATRSATINLTAEVVRVNQPFAPGMIKSAVIIVMRYQ